jgi:hypothetical protein
MRSLALVLTAAVSLLSFVPSARANGRIVVAHDEWTLSTTGFAQAPAATTQFVQNVASWFAGGQAGKFRAWSGNMGVTSTGLAQAMTNAGHTWTVSTAGTFNLATLLQYDGIFVVGTPVDANVLTQYVQAGGNVYICGGTGFSDAANCNPFLQNFGLQFATGYNNLSGVEPISSSHPVFAGVTGLYQNNGNSITDLAPGDPANVVLVTHTTNGLYAIYDGGAPPTTYCTAKTNSLGCVPAIGSSGFPSVSSAASFAITASNVLNQKQGLFFYGHAQAITPFQGGFKCMANPTLRTPVQGSGGSGLPASDCSGVYSLDFNAWIDGGVDPLLTAGQEVDGQFWSRDPASASTIGLTDAIRFVVNS